MNASDPMSIEEIRVWLAQWGTYDDHFNESGEWVGSWWTPIPVAKMNDEQVLVAARQVASGGPRS